ncbi:MAG: DNA repair protein RadA [Bacteroidetes bacterium]|nr:DNA repair protein RadA [Bacteroidota bacterium]MBU1677316.1 DNA repair protein RadA [Bacteroidota bacterium]MBU2507478.1 DNA repair protein RadA [Bacteroidota bacterium]
MSKQRIKYICSNCQHESLRWLGKCPTCDSWNSFSEEIVETRKSSPLKIVDAQITTLDSILTQEDKRIKTEISEFDRVLGGGLMQGSVVLIGGDPGIGKSTLVMQAASKIAGKVLYVTGEESAQQIKLRAERLNVKHGNIFILPETNLEIIYSAIVKIEPDVVIIDSIQTVYKPDFDNTPGTVTQIRESTAFLMSKAKSSGFTVILIGHVTKEGYIAGPKVLEHIVDTVLQFEGDKSHAFRILRAQKNRFGSTNEIGVFEMRESGLFEVTNPSELFLSEKENLSSGSVVTTSLQGTRTVLLEVQALVTSSNFGNPQRVATGFDYRRLSILLAVLEKRVKYKLSLHNVFVNMAGGIKIEEPAADLAVCCAIASSLKELPAKHDYIVIGEVGLGGEVRSVSHIEKRIQEAQKLGFNSAIIPANNLKSLKNEKRINLIPVSDVNAAIQNILK